MSRNLGGIPAALMAAAASAGLFAVFPLIAPFGVLLAVISPLPLAILAFQTSAPRAAVAGLLGVLAIALGVGPFFAVQYAVPFVVCGVLTGTGVRLQWSPQRLLGLVVFSALAVFGGYLLLQTATTGQSPLGYLEHVAKEEMQPVRDAVAGEKFDPQTLLTLEQGLADAERLMGRAAVGILAGFCLFLGWVNAMWLRRTLMKRGLPLPSWAGWKAPESWIWGLIAAGALTALGDETLSAVGLNLLIPLGLVYFFQGLAIVEYLFDVGKASWFIRGVTFTLVFLQLQFTAPLLALAGAFDQWIDIRARWTPPPEKPDTTNA